MFTSFDLIIIVAMVLLAASLVSLVLMFLLKNKKAQRVCFFIAAALGIYLGTVGFRINWPGFFFQAMLAIVLALVCVAAIVIALRKKNDEKMFRIARIMAMAGLVIGFANALLI